MASEQASLAVAWVEVSRSGVSYHLMGIYENSALGDSISKELGAHLNGKSCFRFKTTDAALFKDLEQLTVRALAAFSAAGFVTKLESA